MVDKCHLYAYASSPYRNSHFLKVLYYSGANIETEESLNR